MNFFANLVAAFWMLLGSTKAFAWVKPTLGQFVLFLVIALSANILFAWLVAPEERFFNEQGLLSYMVWPAIVVVAGIVLAKRSLNYSLLFVPAILWLTADTILVLLQSGIQFLENKGWLPFALHSILPNLFVLLFVWQTTALLWIFAKRLHWAWWEKILITSVSIVLLFVWQKNVVNQPIFQAKTQKVMLGEQVFYAQADLLQKTLDGLAPTRKGVHDWYFLGVAPFAEQNVFASEILQAQKRFDTQLGTAGRSMSLINNPQTWLDYPIATRTGIEKSLNAIKKQMNIQEDVLFMVLSSHGTLDEQDRPSGELAVVNEPLDLEQIDAHWLRLALDNAGIRWRVIVVSACYSGTFIEPLKNPNTIIITASNAENASFGCSDDADMTYFGRAFFEQSMGKFPTLLETFNHAVKRVGERETLMGFTPSEPQISMGVTIQEVLPYFEKALFKNLQLSNSDTSLVDATP